MLDFEQELVDQYALAMSAAGLTDRHIGGTRAIVIEFARSLSTPLWEATCADADAFLAQQRRMGLSVSTRAGKSGALSGFYEFVIARYEGTIRRATGVLVEQPIDEFNRRSRASLSKVRVSPSDEEIDSLFSAWRGSVPPRHVNTSPQPATTSPPRCGVDSACGSTRPSFSTSATGAPIWARQTWLHVRIAREDCDRELEAIPLRDREYIASLGGGDGVEQQAGLGVAHAGQAPDPFEYEVELGKTPAAQLYDEVPGAGRGMKALDLGVAADLADHVLPVVGLGDHGGDPPDRIAVHVVAEPNSKAFDNPGVDEPVDS